VNTSEYNKSVDLYSDNVYRFILKSTRDEPLAKDVVQDSFMKLWERHEEVTYSKVKSWLFQTAYRQMIDLLRREKKRGDIDTVGESKMGSSNEGYSDLQELLHQALDRLPEAQKHVVLLRDYEGYNYQEIGEMCQLSESQVKVYIFRARKAMKNYLVSIGTVI